MTTRSLLTAFCILLLTSAAANAQRLSGVVRDANASAPITSAVVSIIDSAGQAVARTVTDRDGRFILPVTAAGRTVEVRRIGFRRVTQPVPDAARAATATLDMTLEPVPQVLDPVQVTEAACPRSSTGGQALAFWEQAQSAFLASIVARDAAPGSVRVVHFDRDMSVAENMVTRAAALMHTYESTRPFMPSRPPETFAVEGYVAIDSIGLQFDGPDADVLLDPSFRATHCFTLAPSTADRRDQIGVVFTPGNGRSGISDIQGTLWMNRAPLAIRSLEFRVVGDRPRIFGAHGGSGSLTFSTADNGVVFVSEWVLRSEETMNVRRVSAATPAGRGGRGGAAGGGATVQERSQAVITVRETGGSVVSVAWQDGTSFGRELREITGSVSDSASGTRLAGIPVFLASTNYTTRTDADGRFVLTHVLPGPYEVIVSDSTLADFGIVSASSSVVEVTPSRSPATALRLQSPLITARAACKGNVLGTGQGIAVVRIVDSASTFLDEPVDVEIQFTGADGSAELNTGGRLPTGRIAICGLQNGTLTVRAADRLGRMGSASVNTNGSERVDTLTVSVRALPP